MRRGGEVVPMAPERARRKVERQARVTFYTLTSPEMQAASNAARLLYVILTTYLNYETGEGWASWGRLARDLGTSRSNVRKLGKELVDLRLVERFSRGKTEMGEDEACGWRLVAPGAPGAREGAVEADGEHACAPLEAHPCLRESPEQDPDPASPKILIQEPHPDGDARADAERLVRDFHAARGLETREPLRAETAFAAKLIREHGAEGAGGIVRFALAKIRDGWRDAATFCAVKVFVARAVSEGWVQQAIEEEHAANARAALEGRLDRTQDPPARCMTALQRDFPPDVVAGLTTKDRWDLVDALGLLDSADVLDDPGVRVQGERDLRRDSPVVKVPAVIPDALPPSVRISARCRGS